MNAVQFRRLTKTLLLGPPGSRPRRIAIGLLRGLSFNVDTASKSMRLIGLDEVEISGHLRKFVSQARAAIDVGAADGWYSLFFASASNIQHVVAFEPEQRLRDAMRENFHLNDPAFWKKMELRAEYIGSQDGPQMQRLDAVAFSLPRPLVMKIDVDGGELEVLRGAEEILAGQDCLLVVETHSVELEQECEAYLSSIGYRTQVIRNGWYRLFVPECRPIPLNRWLVATPRT